KVVDGPGIEAITDDFDAQLEQHFHSRRIESMRRSHPGVGADPLLRKYRQRLVEFRALHVVWQSCKLAVPIDGKQARAPGLVSMLKTMQADEPSVRLPAADPLPEIGTRRFDHQLGIAVIGYDGNQRFDVVLRDNALDASPNRPVHRRAEIIQTYKVPGRHAR